MFTVILYVKDYCIGLSVFFFDFYASVRREGAIIVSFVRQSVRGDEG